MTTLEFNKIEKINCKKFKSACNNKTLFFVLNDIKYVASHFTEKQKEKLEHISDITTELRCYSKIF